jgi:phosphatidate cytidylyltransferase
MKKLIERLIIFFVGLPALLSLVVFLPNYNHLLLNLFLTVFSALGAVELRNILSHKNLHISISEAAIFGAISPASWTLVVSFGLTVFMVPVLFIMGALYLLVSGIFTSSEKLDSYLGRIVAGFSIMIYPGLFMAWVIQMTALREASMVILVFFLLVFLNDSGAWFFGMLFGKGNRGIIAASPNKSIVGFIGGLGASVMVGFVAVVLIPGAFTSKLMPSIPAGIFLGLIAGAAATLGDLCESAIKRSAGVKDSGSLVLGRGGALDSMDSVALAAPVYYVIYQVLF